ncbi:DUF6115 domain-containing protein [Halobacillus sp. H74]|uniref:DUF6115 domain-containing protein n=1 Tax=Halobacillus sp. H74 TaxID=3457436 RepID=UPI003FCDC989
MTVFLLVVSFIIDGVLVMALFAMMKKVRQAEELELRQKQVASEIEDLFTSYLMEIKEENRRMGEWVTQKKDKQEPEAHVMESSSKETDETMEVSESKDYTPPEPVEDGEVYQPSIHSQVFELKKEGYTIEEIAKQLNKGKTEVELLYKFHQKSNKKT